MTDSSDFSDFSTTLTLREHAADALRRARRLPIGAARNDLRQLAIGLRFLDIRQNEIVMPYHIMDIPPGECPLAPL